MSSEAATVDVVLVEDVHTIPPQVDDLVSTMSSEAATVDVLVEGVHARPPQVDDLFSKVHENCNGFIATIIAEAEKEKVAMTAEAQQSAANIVAEAEEKTKEMKIELENWDAEQKRIASTHNFEPTVKLDVGGHSFTTTLITLTRFPDTMLGAMFSGRHALSKDEAGAHFIDRDGTHFREIVNFLRIPDSWDNSGIQGRQLRELMNEAEYYGLKDLMFPELPTGNKEKSSDQTDGHVLYGLCEDMNMTYGLCKDAKVPSQLDGLEQFDVHGVGKPPCDLQCVRSRLQHNVAELIKLSLRSASQDSIVLNGMVSTTL